MIRSLLAVLLLAAPAFAGSQKTTVPQISGLNLPAVNTVPALPTPDLGLGVDLKSADAKIVAPQSQFIQLDPRIQPLRPKAATAEEQKASATPLAPLKAQEAGENAQAPVAPIDASNPASVQVAAELTELRDTLAPDKIADTDLKPLPQGYLGSPEDWRDEVLYSVLLDRFAKGPGAKSVGDPKKGDTRHGGNLKGLTEKLDYIKMSGATTILLSPVAKSLPEAYHNYAPVHFMQIDPHFGSMADMKLMVAEAHKRGLRVVLDIVINHAGPVFEYEGGPSGSGWAPMDQPKKNIGYWTQDLKPAELTAPERFTRRGVINDWNDHDQSLHGDFPPNYRHFSTDEKQTQDLLIHVAKWWIKETDVDGFRLDAIRHVDQGFLRTFRLQVKEYAASLGKDKFLLLGENSTGVDSELADNFKLGLDSVYNYPEYRRVNYALHGKASAGDLANSFHRAVETLGSSLGRVVRFIDNHDTYRFLRAGEDSRALKTALAFLFFSLGIPMLYYGTEQAFRQKITSLDPEGPNAPADPQNREDMFADGQFKSESSQGDKFDQAAEAYNWTKLLADVRAKHPALRRGEQWVRHARADAPGLYAFSRILAGEEVLVGLNTSDAAVKELVWVDANLHKAGDVFFDELDPSFTAQAQPQDGGGLKLEVSVPARGARVLVRKT